MVGLENQSLILMTQSLYLQYSIKGRNQGKE